MSGARDDHEAQAVVGVAGAVLRLELRPMRRLPADPNMVFRKHRYDVLLVVLVAYLVGAIVNETARQPE